MTHLMTWLAGGALVSVFAHCLAKLASDDKIPNWLEGPRIVKKLMARVMNGGGIYTFAGKQPPQLLDSDGQYRGWPSPYTNAQVSDIMSHLHRPGCF